MKINTICYKQIDEFCKRNNFSGVVLAKQKNENFIESAYGYLNRSEEIANQINTRFGIASGCKLFTAIAVCQLVEKGLLTFNTRLKDCLNIEFPNFDESITIHQLLTHTSGIPDYFDEEVMDDFEELWKENPMYLIRELKDFLPLFKNENMMFTPGDRFHYNNAGFILLGLIVEKKSGKSFTNYVIDNIFKPCKMEGSGYFSLDCLPKNTALGYIDNEENGTWRTNIYSLPVKGGSDGGAFVTAPDIMKLWDGLLNHILLSKETTDLLLMPLAHAEDEEYYGYGIWISKRENEIFKYHVMGYDPGVSFASSYYPGPDITLVIPSNQSYGPHDITDVFEEYM
ncbi:serine hydrolase domain-containing protein [Bacillus sp. REN16]|uniref:serine hydrolase domain-containing protein n=1 Tax=Bacillus sp. REN16 TaxID=2887296 RepID=UPI001E2CB3B0|nr:serine hydrolase [Bacillus sp. REN16]MCC3355843.1 beta-lactamase family protein [Bacillus sp. REN16]